MEKSKRSEFIDTDYSHGDSKMMTSKQKYTEENNNEVDKLSKNFSEMGCIVDPAQRPSNICIETCVYEESSGDEEQTNENENDADAYSDEFEEDKSEEEVLKLEPVSPKSESTTNVRSQPNVVKKTNSLSQSSMSSRPPASVSGRSTGLSSTCPPPTRRVNMSFTNERLREIERHNHILLNKILTARNTKKTSIPSHEPPRRPVPAAAVLRKQQQKKIDHDNMILLKKIQRAKSSAHGERR
ncbi:hemingway [Choristoneura fumiferana]|uniref:hemingway n=1 Tax=Choristoneura fumiferana TaxID=7141 RepID=UPI003D156CF6